MGCLKLSYYERSSPARLNLRTSFSRPATIEEDAYKVAFEYNDAGERTKMGFYAMNALQFTRYYLGGNYEKEVDNNGAVVSEHLYLGGSPYSAPAVYSKENGEWKLYYLHRDYLGSIRAISDEAGNKTDEYSYDAWGRLRNPATGENYNRFQQPTLKFNRGYTSHEHLPWFGLINMNARLYDPILGRFLSPDPYVQAPDWSQNFNRYTYAANNPMLYVDENGEFFFTAVGIGVLLNAACWGAAISAAAYTASVAFSDGGFNNWNWGQFGKSLGIGAVSGFVTGGLGQAFGPIGNFGHEVSRAYFHGFANGAISTLSGGDFLQGFASGGLGSLGGSAFQAWGGDFAKSAFGTVGFSALSGGIGAVATGGDFWRGAGTGAIVGLLNHAQIKATQKLDWRRATHGEKIRAFLDAYKEAIVNGKEYFDFRDLATNYPTYGGAGDLMAFLTINGEEVLVHMRHGGYKYMTEISTNVKSLGDVGPFKVVINGILKVGRWANYEFRQYYTEPYRAFPAGRAWIQVPIQHNEIFRKYFGL